MALVSQCSLEATICDYAQRIMKHPEKKQAIAQKFGQIFPKQASIFLIHQPRWKQLFERWKIVRFTRDHELSQSCAATLAQMDRRQKLQYYLATA